MKQQERIFYARSHTLAMWLVARGYEPVRCEIARDNGTIIYVFHESAAELTFHLDEFHQAKKRLEQMRADAHLPAP